MAKGAQVTINLVINIGHAEHAIRQLASRLNALADGLAANRNNDSEPEATPDVIPQRDPASTTTAGTERAWAPAQRLPAPAKAFGFHA